MRFSILGPLAITADDRSQVVVTRRLHRIFLALLLRGSGRAISRNHLIEGLWGDDPPLHPEVSLRSCVYGARKSLPAPGRVRSTGSGYLIEVRPGELDLTEFRDLSGQGRQALDQGNAHAAAALLAQALALWREPPVADLPADRDTGRLLDQRTDVQEALIDAQLAIGRHRLVLADVRSAVAENPLREHAWAQLMIALYRCGARAEALAAFGRLRMMLVAEHGLEPGPELQELHRKVLADDPALVVARHLGDQAVTATPRRPPGQLPASVADFTGRAAELGFLLNRLADPGHRLPDPGHRLPDPGHRLPVYDVMPVTVISGMPGCGKTALAVRAAQLARQRFPDGQLYASLDGAHAADAHARYRPSDPHEVLGELLRALGVPAAEVPASRFERAARYRSLLAGRRVLVLVDGAARADQVRPLLPGAAGSAVLVASCSRLADLEGAGFIELGALVPAEALSLLTGICGRSLSGPDIDAAEAIVAACEYLPLAVRIAGARLAEDPGLTLPGLAALLADHHRRLDELCVGTLSVRARLDAAAAPLSAVALNTLASLAMEGPRGRPGPRDLPGSLIAELVQDADGRRIAPALADAGLLRRVAGDRPGGGTYRMHGLVREYALMLLARAEPGIAGVTTGRPRAASQLELARQGEESGELRLLGSAS
jgi:DNA-binding SARP family transcriptional activator